MPTQLSPQERVVKIATIRAFPAELESIVAGLSNAQLDAHPLPGEWSVRQNVHHVADSHMNSFIRCKLILTEDHPTLRPYDQEVWAAQPDTTVPPVSASLALLRGLHARWVLLFESLTETQWARTGYHPEMQEDVSLDDQLVIYDAHCKAHLDQIARALAAQG